MNYFRRQSNNTTCILLIKVYTQSNRTIPIINKAAVINSTTTSYNEVTLKSLLRSEISSAQQQSQSSQSEGVNKNKRRTISITNNSVDVQTIEGTNINALLDLPICNLFDVLNKQQQQGSSSNSDNNSSYEIIVIVKGHDIDDTNEATRRNSSSSTNIRKQNASPRIVRILIILALLAIISEIFVPNTTISSSTSNSDASFATPTSTTTTTQHHKSSQTINHINANPIPNANRNNNPNVNRNTNLGKRQVQIEQCTPSELSLILYQLPNEDCYTYKKQPWRQKCSLTYATKCPGMFVGLLCLFLFVLFILDCFYG